MNLRSFVFLFSLVLGLAQPAVVLGADQNVPASSSIALACPAGSRMTVGSVATSSGSPYTAIDRLAVSCSAVAIDTHGVTSANCSAGTQYGASSCNAVSGCKWYGGWQATISKVTYPAKCDVAGLQNYPDQSCNIKGAVLDSNGQPIAADMSKCTAANGCGTYQARTCYQCSALVTLCMGLQLEKKWN